MRPPRLGTRGAETPHHLPSIAKELVAGSGIEFAERGEHQLKGVPGWWRIHAVAGI
jgi:hypothetical protein